MNRLLTATLALLAFGLLVSSPSPVRAQSAMTTNGVPPSLSVIAEIERPVPPRMTDPGDLATLQSLEALHRAIAIQEAAVTALQNELAAATDDMQRADVLERLKKAREELDGQRGQFEGFATAIDLTLFMDHKKAPFDWQQQIGKLLEPILSEFENATAETRIVGQLRSQVGDAKKRRDLAGRAVTNLTQILSLPASEVLRARLTQRRDAWQRIYDQADNESSGLQLQLQAKLAARESVLDQTTGFAKRFFQTRGLNLLRGTVAFMAVFFAFRLGDHLMRKLRRKGDEKRLGSRVATLVFHLLSILGGLLAMMLAFNQAGDWFLLGLILIFLFGAAWAGIKMLPALTEEIKLMLNIGAVREGELLIYDSTPYRVESLSFKALLNNPTLEGGTRLLPVKYLVGMNSRPIGPDESWFPSRKGEWVTLSDGITGWVLSQSPGMVELGLPGGERKCYRVADYLALQPQNMTRGFRISSVFGIDYRHQAECTGAIPAKMLEKLRAGLPAVAGTGNLLDVQVIFREAGASSLNYTILADLKGPAAPVSRLVSGAIQRILVEACNEYGWEIPFNQITVHNAGPKG